MCGSALTCNSSKVKLKSSSSFLQSNFQYNTVFNINELLLYTNFVLAFSSSDQVKQAANNGYRSAGAARY